MPSSGSVNVNSDAMTRIAAILFCALLWLMPSPSAHCIASSSIRDVVVSADPDSLFAGDRFHYIVTVRHDGAKRVSVEELATGRGTMFELVRRTDSSGRLPDGGLLYRMEAELAAFGNGRVLLPAFTVVFRDAAGNMERLAVPPARSLVVMGMTDSTVTQLRPLRPSVKPGLPARVLFPVLAAALIIFSALLYGIARVVGKIRRDRSNPAYVARMKLRSLDRQLSRGMPPGAGYEALSNITREFLQNRYRFRAMGQVTKEIAEELASREVPGRDAVLRFLTQADLIKFADGRPELEECRRSIKIAENLVATAEQAEGSAPERQSTDANQ